MSIVKPARPAKVMEKGSWKKDFHENKALYLLFLPIAAYFIIFNYIPMAGVLMAFQDVNPNNGIFGSEWIGFRNFVDLFTGETFLLALRNTVCMALLNLTLGFIVPVLLALLFTEIRHKTFGRFSQIVSYIPNFVSTVVICVLAKNFLSKDGPITVFLSSLGINSEAGWLFDARIPVFWIINCCLGIWQGSGWGSIGYVASISNINHDLYEAAAIDGAGRWKRLWYITLPGLKSFVIMMLIVRIGLIFVTGFDNVLLLYSPTIYDTADVLSTYTYRVAFSGIPNYGLSTASGLFQSVVATVLLLLSNWLSKKLSNSSLF